MNELSKSEAMKIFTLHKDIIYSYFGRKNQKVEITEIEKLFHSSYNIRTRRFSNENGDIIIECIMRQPTEIFDILNHYIIPHDEIKIQNRKEKIQSILNENE